MLNVKTAIVVCFSGAHKIHVLSIPVSFEPGEIERDCFTQGDFVDAEARFLREGRLCGFCKANCLLLSLSKRGMIHFYPFYTFPTSGNDNKQCHIRSMLMKEKHKQGWTCY